MTATTFGSVRSEATEQRRFPLAPAEGWTTLGLVLLLCLTLAWSIDDASWVVGPRGLTDFLPLAIVLGVGWGFVSAKVGWSRWLAHLLGATFAALLLPMIVGARLVDGGGPVEWFQATAASCVNAYFDLTYRGLPFTTQIGHFLLVLGLLAWATGQYAGYVTFHHRRPLNAVIVIGVGLVANMSLTIRDQLPYLVIYSLAALFLLIRFHAYDERLLWMRHRIGDAASLGSLYLRGGAVFVASAVVIALVLTSSASSAPLASLWKGVDQKLIEVGREFQRVFRGGGQGTRFNGVDFPGTASILGSWTTDPTPVLDITVPDSGHYYWRAVVYDKFDGLSLELVEAGRERRRGEHGAARRDRRRPERPQGAPDRPVRGHRARVRSPVGVLARHPDRGRRRDEADDGLRPRGEARASSPGSRPTRRATRSPPACRSSTRRIIRRASARTSSGSPAQTTRTASTRSTSTTTRASSDPPTRKLSEAILARYPDAAKDPYDLARSITNYLTTDGGFTYDADVRDIDCGRNIVECFAVHKRGYCEYYASTMVMLLRLNGVPARFAEGFLPGQRDRSGVEQILKSNSHAWVEVYFPGFGWQQFDPTGGGVGQDVPLPPGPRVSAAPATPRGSLGTDDPGELRRSIRPTAGAGAGTTGGGGPGSGPFIVIGLLLAIVVGGAGVPRLAARDRGRRPSRRSSGGASSGWPAGSASRLARARPSSSTRARSARCCPTRVPTSRRSPGRRSRWPTGGASSATTGCDPCATPSAGFGSRSSGCCSGDASVASAGGRRR